MAKQNDGSFVTRLRREIGERPKFGSTACLQHSLASKIEPHHTWDPRKTVHETDHGGIFNFDFSKTGTLLGVACERKSVLLFDPFNGQLVTSKTNIHTDCVNCVKFLDDRLFATCSDDTTVALWDTRYLKHNVRSFLGHSNWVKNIEFDPNNGLLITSGFDGCIYTWDINRYSEEESSNRVFYTSGLMRSKLSPDFTKLFISTHEGYIIVINNLDLSTLGEDLKGFKPNMYRLMQRSQTPLRIALMFNHVFEQQRNRVEFISDWPLGNDANIISSLQVHPQGWCILSRNTDSTENAEWTCVHDIQDEKLRTRDSPPRWEVETVTPHTSSAYCSSTNTPAFSSQAPTNRQSSQASTNRNQSDNSGDQSEGSNNDPSNQEAVDGSERIASVQGEANSSQNSSRQSHSTGNNLRGSGSEPDRSRREGTDGDVMAPRPDMFNPTGAEVHDSLIQIRRGARDADGNFSFSISVHTSNGHRIEFNQSDLESEDDEDISIQQIIGSNNANVERFSQNVDGSNEQPSPVHSPSTLGNQLEDNDRGGTDPEGDSVSDSDDVGLEELVANNPDHAFDDDDEDGDFIPESDDDRDYDFSYDSEEGDNGRESDEDLEAEHARQDDDLNEPLFIDDSGPPLTPQPARNNTFERAQENIRQFFGNTASGGNSASNSASNHSIRSVENNAETSHQSNRGSSNATGGVDSIRNAEVTVPVNAPSVPPRTNTFMFVLQSNSGDRRRRYLNLSYMDSYSERENTQLQQKIHMNKRRLLGYVEECNVGRGFIKELAFSADGRLVSSPFGYGLRIFAFDPHCNELCDCVPDSPVKLYEVKCSLAHGNCVVATKFSPCHNLVVSGCLDGKIAFHQPVL